MIKTTVRKIGNSLGLILPARALQALHVSEGDTIFLTESPDRLRMTAYDPDFEEAVKLAEGVMGRYRNALRGLGK